MREGHLELTSGENPQPRSLPADVERVLRSDARRAALRGLEMLDSPADPDFDHLTAMAALVMKTPVALVTLLEIDRQWFKSRHGVDFTETPTEISFCAHTIAADGDIMEILDPTTPMPRASGRTGWTST